MGSSSQHDAGYIEGTEKHQIQFVDTMVPASPTPCEEEAVEHMSWKAYLGLFVRNILSRTSLRRCVLMC
jgi:hypothetical protein